MGSLFVLSESFKGEWSCVYERNQDLKWFCIYKREGDHNWVKKILNHEDPNTDSLQMYIALGQQPSRYSFCSYRLITRVELNIILFGTDK